MPQEYLKRFVITRYVVQQKLKIFFMLSSNQVIAKYDFLNLNSPGL